MRLPTILKIVFGLLYILWVAALYMLMPPVGTLNNVGVLAGAAGMLCSAITFIFF